MVPAARATSTRATSNAGKNAGPKQVGRRLFWRVGRESRRGRTHEQRRAFNLAREHLAEPLRCCNRPAQDGLVGVLHQLGIALRFVCGPGGPSARVRRHTAAAMADMATTGIGGSEEPASFPCAVGVRGHTAHP